jgi:hypothetical protein
MLRYGLRSYKIYVLKKGKKCIFGTLRFTSNCVFNTNSVQMVRHFFEQWTVGRMRYGTLEYGALVNSDKNGLPTVLRHF